MPRRTGKEALYERVIEDKREKRRRRSDERDALKGMFADDLDNDEYEVRNLLKDLGNS